jgi:hypothetical protein
VGEENSHNAWYVKTTVQGAPAGKLAGKTVALKDNIMLAGVPMMNGSATLEGYMPDIDATVVERILDAGGTIVGQRAILPRRTPAGAPGLPTSPPPVAMRLKFRISPVQSMRITALAGFGFLKWGVTRCMPPTRISPWRIRSVSSALWE